MARPLRIEPSGAIYHVTSRRNERKPIYRDDRDRERFVDRLTVAAGASAHGGHDGTDNDDPWGTLRPPPGYVRPRHYAWAELLKHTFSTDILACGECGGRLRLVSTITEQAAIEKILRHLGLPTDLPSPTPARSPPWLPGLADEFCQPSADEFDQRPAGNLPD